jgi:hypothetical protein
MLAILPSSLIADNVINYIWHEVKIAHAAAELHDEHEDDDYYLANFPMHPLRKVRVGFDFSQLPVFVLLP